MILPFTILLVVLIVLILAISRWRVHPFVALLVSALALGLLWGNGGQETVAVVLDGFGSTLRWIALVVIFGAFIGEVLSETGGAVRIAEAVVKRTGTERLPWAMGLTGYLVSIPVFVDVAYIVLRPVTDALAARSGKPILVIGLSLAAGLTASHTLIPPTAGPLAVAALVDADLGRLLLVNGFVAVVAMTGGILWASRCCRSYRLDYDTRLEGITSNTQSENSQFTPVFTDLLPIFFPIVLMAAGSFAAGGDTMFRNSLVFLGTPTIAVMLGAGLAAFQLRVLHRRDGIGELVERAISKSALIIMITGAGGAFGHVIRESGTATLLAEQLAAVPALSLVLPFLLAAILTTATGSVTVALIGSASILGPMTSSLPYSPEILAALIGSGAFCVFHANSSFFWLLEKLYDVPLAVLYRTFTLQSLCMGISGLGAVLLLFLLGVR